MARKKTKTASPEPPATEQATVRKPANGQESTSRNTGERAVKSRSLARRIRKKSRLVSLGADVSDTVAALIDSVQSFRESFAGTSGTVEELKSRLLAGLDEIEAVSDMTVITREAVNEILTAVEEQGHIARHTGNRQEILTNRLQEIETALSGLTPRTDDFAASLDLMERQAAAISETADEADITAVNAALEAEKNGDGPSLRASSRHIQDISRHVRTQSASTGDSLNRESARLETIATTGKTIAERVSGVGVMIRGVNGAFNDSAASTESLREEMDTLMEAVDDVFDRVDAFIPVVSEINDSLRSLEGILEGYPGGPDDLDGALADISGLSGRLEDAAEACVETGGHAAFDELFAVSDKLVDGIDGLTPLLRDATDTCGDGGTVAHTAAGSIDRLSACAGETAAALDTLAERAEKALATITADTDSLREAVTIIGDCRTEMHALIKDMQPGLANSGETMLALGRLRSFADLCMISARDMRYIAGMGSGGDAAGEGDSSIPDNVCGEWEKQARGLQEAADTIFATLDSTETGLVAVYEGTMRPVVDALHTISAILDKALETAVGESLDATAESCRLLSESLADHRTHLGGLRALLDECASVVEKGSQSLDAARNAIDTGSSHARTLVTAVDTLCSHAEEIEEG